MSRVGLQPIEIPEGVTVKEDGGKIEVSGVLGKLEWKFRPEIKVKIQNGLVLVKRDKDTKVAKSLHGLTRSLIANMIIGVNKGWEKKLEIQGTGYRAKAEGERLVLSLGFSHPVVIEPVEGIKFEVDGNNKIKIFGTDKILVGNTAAKIRGTKPPDAYKGKGVRYEGEIVKLKPGKAGKAGAAA